TSWFFFFQAEDGIRDWSVTGVQTCALPIFWGVYSTTTTFEIGHRFVDTDGSRDRYLSDVNVRDGWRVLEYSTDMRAQPGSGLLFDFLKADVSNAGGDQSQTFSLRMDKTRAYRFDGNVRRFNYYP